jgi:hypothetical protein
MRINERIRLLKIKNRENIEMLYVYIEPIISRIINDIKKIPSPTHEDIVHVFREYM